MAFSNKLRQYLVSIIFTHDVAGHPRGKKALVVPLRHRNQQTTS